MNYLKHNRGGYFKVEDSNMVTNACYNLLNGRTRTYFGDPAPATQYTPLLQYCFSGLLLFDKNITEDSNCIIPPAGTLQVGSASGTYAGSDLYRGSLNTAESKDLENGYRFVWDFGTDKANGTIKSVALTSFAGGCGGVRQTDFNAGSRSVVHYRDATLEKQINNGWNGFSPFAEASSSNNEYAGIVGNFERDVVLFAGKVSSERKSVLFTKKKYYKNKAFLKKEINTEEIIQTKVVTTEKFLSDPWRFSTDGTYIYSIYAHDGNQLDYIKIDGISLNVIEEKNFVIQDASFVTQGLATVVGNKCYVQKSGTTSTTLILYEINLEDVSDYALLPEIKGGLSNSNMTNFNGNLAVFYMVNFADANNRLAIYTNGEWQYSRYNSSLSGLGGYCRGGNFLNSKFLDEPYLFLVDIMNDSRENMYYSYLYQFVYVPFLSTINNLSTPVVKNETQTMKVTYEITEI